MNKSALVTLELKQNEKFFTREEHEELEEQFSKLLDEINSFKISTNNDVKEYNSRLEGLVLNTMDQKLIEHFKRYEVVAKMFE